MPETSVLFYKEDDGDVPVRDWLNELKRKDKKAFAKCISKIRLLQAMGHELRRPSADYLRDGISELRIRQGRVNYRILYFFHGKNVALLAHGLTKESQVPPKDIDRAVERKRKYEQDPVEHTYEKDVING